MTPAQDSMGVHGECKGEMTAAQGTLNKRKRGKIGKFNKIRHFFFDFSPKWS